MAAFIKGKELCRGFFEQVAKPILDRRFPGLVYSAGLLGYGSDVLGYDDAVSTDHMWGPRFYLFLREEDKALQPQILEAFSQEFPYTYRGYSVHFSRPDPSDKGIRHAEAITQGQVDPSSFSTPLRSTWTSTWAPTTRRPSSTWSGSPCRSTICWP